MATVTVDESAPIASAPGKTRDIALDTCILLGVAALIAVAFYAGRLSDRMTIAAFAGAILPATLALIVAGVGKKRPSFAGPSLFCLIAIAVSYLIVERARVWGADYAGTDTWIAELFATAQVPVAALLWCELRAKHDGAEPALPSFGVGAITAGNLAALACLTFASQLYPRFALSPRMMCAAYGLALLAPLLLNGAQAMRESQLAQKNKDPIEDADAGVFVSFVALIVGLGIWSATTGAAGATARIDRMTGLITIGFLSVAFVALAAPPSAVSRTFKPIFSVLGGLARPVGIVFRAADRLLVYPVAAGLGATQSSWHRRYALLLGNMLPCAALGWWLPAPYGLVGLAGAFVGALAIGRRWAWIEDDRENAMMQRSFEGAHIRVGFDQDLRDEALVAFGILLLLVPLAMRQFYLVLGPDTFVVANPSDANNVLAWLSFFGTELAKALPFVDWAEVYHVEGSSPIELNDDRITAGNHVLFAARILVDTVLLAAFLQAISVVQRGRKLMEMFYGRDDDKGLDRLDPFRELQEFRKLLGDDGRFDKDRAATFPRYNEDRLKELLGKKDEREIVARGLLDLYHLEGPEQQLLSEASRRNPDQKRLERLLDGIRNLQRELDVDKLKAAHAKLNDHSLGSIRQAVIALIAEQLPSDAAIGHLSSILSSLDGSEKDKIWQNRRVALTELVQLAVSGNPLARFSIERAATHDAAPRLRKEAEELARTWGWQPGAAPPPH